MKAKLDIWSFIAAAWVVGLIALVSNQKPNAPQRKRNNHAHPSEKLKVEPISDQSKYEEWHSDEREHKAEERAYWRRQSSNSKWALIFSIFTFGTALIAVGIAYFAFQASSQAVVQARREADAATNPYLFATFKGGDTIHGWITQGQFGRGWAIDVQMEVTNYGAGPAILTSLDCIPVWGRYEKAELGLLDKIPKIEARGFTSLMVIGGKDTKLFTCPWAWAENENLVGYNPGWKPMDTLGALQRGKFAIWMIARIKYQDFARTPGESLFCARYKDIGGATRNDLIGFEQAAPPRCENH